MQLLKIFSFKGLYNNGNRMAQPAGYFRRFKNSFKDKTGRIKNFGIGPATVNGVYNNPLITPSSVWKYPISSVRYSNGIVQTILGIDATETGLGAVKFTREGIEEAVTMPPYRSNNVYPNTLSLTTHTVVQPSEAGTTAVVNRKAYMNFSINLEKYFDSNFIVGTKFTESFCLSFDGVRPRATGLPLPWLTADFSGVLAAHYIRTVYCTVGLDGEAIFSPFMQQRLSSATRTVYLGGYSAYPATPHSDPTLLANANPVYRPNYDSLFERDVVSGYGPVGDFNFRYFDSRFIRFGANFNVSAGVITVTPSAISTSPDGLINLVQTDDWLMIDIQAPVGDIPATTYMFQVNAVGGTVTFKTRFKYFDRNSLIWLDDDFSTVWARWGAINVGIQNQFLALARAFGTFTNIFQIISYSTTENAGYRVSQILPVCWDSALSVASVNLATPYNFSFPFLGVVTTNLADWYDTSTAKTLFPPMNSITAYKELLVGCDRKAIYFSDTTLGGSTEMVNGNSNFVPLGSEYGDITAVCGSEEFFYVSRERRNYVVRGDLATGNIQVIEADSSIEGAYNGNCVANALSGRVVFMNRTGIYAITATGSIEEISKDIRGLFIDLVNEETNLFNQSVFRTTAQLLDAFFDGSKFKIALDEERNFLLFSFARTSTFSIIDQSFTYLFPSNALIYDMNDGAWYEWDTTGSTLMESIKSKTYCLGANIKLEDGTMRGAEVQDLATSWMTADQPSLEKQITQVKWFGKVSANGSSRTLTVQQQNDWKTDLVTDVVYSTTDKYIHKQRLDSSKAQATSVVFKSTATTHFEMEGMEIEGDIIQEGVKK